MLKRKISRHHGKPAIQVKYLDPGAEEDREEEKAMISTIVIEKGEEGREFEFNNLDI